LPEVVATDGVLLHYDVFGRRDGPPLLLIQGLGTDSRGWALQRLALGRKYRCIAPDNRGTGRTELTDGPYSLEQMAIDALTILDAEGVGSAHVMGASMGGVIAQIIGVLHPHRTRSLVLACTACRHHTWRKELLAEWAEAVRDGGMAALGDGALEWLVGPRLRKRFGIWINLLARIVLQSPPEPFIAQIEAILEAPDELAEELATLRVPVLVITGSQDSLTPVGDAEELAERIPGARLEVLAGAAHGLMVEAPNAFNDAVLRFLGEVEAVASATDEQARGA
jgi:3-oxoadipate enol-lactonase